MTVKIDYKYDLKLSNQALKTLLELKTPISSNLLHKISQKTDERVLILTDILEDYKKYYKTLDYSQQKELASKELEKRGNPPYNPSEYLVKDKWKL